MTQRQQAGGFYLVVSSDFHYFALTISYRFAKMFGEKNYLYVNGRQLSFSLMLSIFHIVAFSVRPDNGAFVTGQTECYKSRDDIAVRCGSKKSSVKQPLIYKIASASSFILGLL
ncbi:MAG: hypothetical protein ACSLEN_10455 [Candidatus Malihini olakiniferum]